MSPTDDAHEVAPVTDMTVPSPIVRVSFLSESIARAMHGALITTIPRVLAEMGGGNFDNNNVNAHASLYIDFYDTHYEDKTGLDLINDDPEQTDLYVTPLYDRAVSEKEGCQDSGLRGLRNDETKANRSTLLSLKNNSHGQEGKNFPGEHGSHLYSTDRLHVQLKQEENMPEEYIYEPGKLSTALREALGISEYEVPFYILRMRELGYPPGWKGKAGIDRLRRARGMLGDVAVIGEEFDGSITENNEESGSSAAVESDPVKYPGYNVPDSYVHPKPDRSAFTQTDLRENGESTTENRLTTATHMTGSNLAVQTSENTMSIKTTGMIGLLEAESPLHKEGASCRTSTLPTPDISEQPLPAKIESTSNSKNKCASNNNCVEDANQVAKRPRTASTVQEAVISSLPTALTTRDQTNLKCSSSSNHPSTTEHGKLPTARSDHVSSTSVGDQHLSCNLGDDMDVCSDISSDEDNVYAIMQSTTVATNSKNKTISESSSTYPKNEHRGGVDSTKIGSSATIATHVTQYNTSSSIEDEVNSSHRTYDCGDIEKEDQRESVFKANGNEGLGGKHCVQNESVTQGMKVSSPQKNYSMEGGLNKDMNCTQANTVSVSVANTECAKQLPPQFESMQHKPSFSVRSESSPSIIHHGDECENSRKESVRINKDDVIVLDDHEEELEEQHDQAKNTSQSNMTYSTIGEANDTGSDVTQKLTVIQNAFSLLLSEILRDNTYSCRSLLQTYPVLVQMKDCHGATPLHVACARGNTPLALDLITMGATVNARTNEGDTPLHNAVFVGKVDLIRLLLRHNADKTILSNDGVSVIDLAFQHSEPIRKLLC